MVRTSFKYAGLLLMLLGLLACQREPPEQRLRQTVASMQLAVEQRKAGDFMDAVAPDFVGNNGVGPVELERMLRAHLLLNGQVGATTGPLQVTVTGTTAEVDFTVVLHGGNGRFLPERGRVMAISSHWREEDGQWKVYRAEWGQGSGD